MNPLTKAAITFVVSMATAYLRNLILDWLGVRA